MTALRRVVRPEKSVTDTNNLPTQPGVPTASVNPEIAHKLQPVMTDTKETKTPHQTQLAELRQAVKNMSMPLTNLKQELNHQPTVERLAKIVDEADTAKRQEAFEATPAMVASALATSRSTNLLGVPHQEFRKPEVIIAKNEIPPNQSEAAMKRDFETMTNGELVRLAERVPLGQGRYLATAFNRGEIGREDLIKVLKSHKKGLDYRQEFADRVEKYQRQREVSPEVLRPPGDEPDEPSQNDMSGAKTNKKTETTNSEDDAPLELDTPRDSAKRQATQTSARLRQQSTVWLFYASVVLVLLVMAIVLVLLNS